MYGACYRGTCRREKLRAVFVRLAYSLHPHPIVFGRGALTVGVAVLYNHLSPLGR